MMARAYDRNGTGPSDGPRAPSARRGRRARVRPQRRHSQGTPPSWNCDLSPAATRSEVADRVSRPAHRHQVDADLELDAIVARTHREGTTVLVHRTIVLACGSIRIADRNLCLDGQRIKLASALRGGNRLLVAATPPQRGADRLRRIISPPEPWLVPTRCRLPPNASNTG